MQMPHNYDFFMLQQIPPPPKPKEPPLFIPFILIVLLSSSFVYVILKYLDKNFIAPLITIQDKLIKVKNGDYNVEFNTKSENNTLVNTFNTLNIMVSGLAEKKKLQENFIQSLVHDLRAPIHAQERAINILKDEFKNHELLEGLSENNETYIKMINLILEVYSDKAVKIEKMNFNLYDLAETVIHVLKPSADSKKIKIINSIDRKMTICADYISVNRIITNLVANAVENIDVNCSIEIKAYKNSKNSVLIIEDNGKGIKKENIQHIFEKYSSNNSRTNKIISGLGLYIVKNLVEQNGGNIKVESEENQYTRFIIEIPKNTEV